LQLLLAGNGALVRRALVGGGEPNAKLGYHRSLTKRFRTVPRL
jgi:hypothetical protein